MSVEWKTALTSILEQLDDQQYKKMLFCSYFDKIPKSMKTSKSREEMPQTIIQYLGVDDSISATKEAMDQIPKMDSADKLRPFVDKLSIKQEEQTKGKKRKHESDRNSADKEPKTKPKFKKTKVVNDSDSSDEEQNAAADELKRSRLEKERDNQSWRKARKLICVPSRPVYSIAEVRELPEKFGVTVEGTVTEIRPVVETEVRAQQRTTKRQEFLLQKDEESIRICMWGENTEQVKEISVGDVVNVTNVKTSRYNNTVSLNSTGFTRILLIEKAPVQKDRIEIQAIQRILMDTFVKSTQFLANEFMFGPRLDGNFKENLLNKMTFSAGPQRENLQRNLPAGGSVSAEATLQSVRPEFIDRVSKSNLDQLLDKLLHSVVINDGEMESIKTGTRAKQARKVIDMVRKKGNDPSSRFITILCELDPYLSRELKLRDD